MIEPGQCFRKTSKRKVGRRQVSKSSDAGIDWGNNELNAQRRNADDAMQLRFALGFSFLKNFGVVFWVINHDLSHHRYKSFPPNIS